ncbi:MAG: SpoIIE family protein phosphatase [Actinomycetota bacterium]
MSGSERPLEMDEAEMRRVLTEAQKISADEVRRARRSEEKIKRLQQVTSALSRTMTVDEIVEVILDQVAGAFRAAAGVVALLDADRNLLQIRGTFGYGPDVVEKWGSFSLSADVPLSQAVRESRTIVVPSRERFAELYPNAGVALSGRSLVAVPVCVGGECAGAIGFSFMEERSFPQEDLAFLESLGQQCGQALERNRLLEEEKRARSAAEEAHMQLQFLAEASDLLSQSLDYATTLRDVARLAVPRLCDWCTVEVLEADGTTHSLGVEHADPAEIDLALEVRRRWPTPPDSEVGLPNVLRTGKPELYHHVTDDLLKAVAQDDEHLEALRGLGFASGMIMPLIARGRTLGAITMISAESGRLFDEEDLVFAMDLARRAAMSVDNARLYQERTYVARTLQRSLLPPRLPIIPGLELATRYRPAREGSEVGGDFYDVFQDGFNGWAVVIGDVQGKGAAAAAITGLARHSLRATAMLQPRPSAVLSALNDVLLQDDTERFCTVAYLRLMRSEGGFHLVAASGGHPLPIKVSLSGDIEPVGEGGTLIGLFPDFSVENVETVLAPGDSIVLYTDGVVEQRSGDELGEDGLKRVIAEAAGSDAETMARLIEEAVIEKEEGLPLDDVAIMVIRVLGED